jgi:hypothetical protein
MPHDVDESGIHKRSCEDLPETRHLQKRDLFAHENLDFTLSIDLASKLFRVYTVRYPPIATTRHTLQICKPKSFSCSRNV